MNEVSENVQSQPLSDVVPSPVVSFKSSLVAVLIALAMWAWLLIPGWVAPLTQFHFTAMMTAGLAGGIALTVWWISQTALTAISRFLGWGFVVALIAISFVFLDSSLLLLMAVMGIPIALSMVALGLLLGSGRAWKLSKWIPFGLLLAFVLAAQLVRADEMDAAFNPTLVYRYADSPEEVFLAELGASQVEPPNASENGASVDAESPFVLVKLPEVVGESDWTEFRGSGRRGVVQSVFETNWEAKPPKEIWRRKVGPGWSSVTVVGDAVFTQEQRGQDQYITAYRRTDGQPLWELGRPGRFEASMGGLGPRATPTYFQGRLYATLATGVAVCVDPATGEELWEFDLTEGRKSPMPPWGFSASPLVFDGKVFLVVGGGPDAGVICLDALSGERVWIAGQGSHSYASAQREEIDGIVQVISSTDWGIESLDPVTGETLWSHKWDIGPQARVVQPMVIPRPDATHDVDVYLGTGYGNGTRRLKLTHSDQWNVEEDWTGPLKPYFNDFVFHDDVIYGFDGPLMMALDALSGEKLWKVRGFGHGQLLLVEPLEMLLILGEEGQLGLLPATRERSKPVAEMQVLEGVTWNHPVIVDGQLIVRNKNEIALYELP
ncbi:MAG: PQQ-binding-like beta-propeller repeat protein [Planctomycetota bacterium]